MRQVDVFIITLTVSLILIQTILVLFNESRITVYLVVTILIYYIVYTMVEPEIYNKKYINILNVILITIFIISIVYRLLNILGIY